MSVVSREQHRMAELPASLTRALFELSAGEQKQRPWIVVMDTVTKKFVQFASVETEPRFGQCPILIDIPNQEFTRADEMCLAALGFEKHPLDVDCGWTWNLAFSPEEMRAVVGTALTVLEIFRSKDENMIEIERGITDSDGGNDG